MRIIYKLLAKKSAILLSVFFVLFVFGCYQGVVDPIDNQTGLTRKEFQNTLLKDKSKKSKSDNDIDNSQVPLPKFSRVLAMPKSPKVGGDKLITFSITEQVSLKDVLMELGRVAKIDVDIDPAIDGTVIISAKDRPFMEVIERICEMGGIRYTYKDGILHFENDDPYAKHYIVDYLSTGQLWGEVQTNITAILGADASSSISINKTAGIMTIYADSKQHKDIELYLKEVQKNASAQVLIEAKIIEVTLNDDYSTGIDWSWTAKNGADTLKSTGGFTDSNPVTLVLGDAKRLFHGSLNASISALETFGTVRAVSSPRITAMNNQNAKLDFTTDVVYFKIERKQDDLTNPTGGTNSRITSTSTPVTISQGITLDIAPSINLKTNEITLNVKPELSRAGDFKDDPINLGNKVPQMIKRTLNTTAKIQNGEVLVIGGLMSDDSSNTEVGVPFLGRIPILGYLFKSSSRKSNTVETVIFIKATIIDNGNATSRSDRDFHDKFDLNPQPYL